MNPKLMLPVERIVRPIYAHGTQKSRMREELYAHLAAIYEEECSGEVDEELAFSKALERFGDPKVIRQELQRTVNPVVQLQGRLDRLFARRSGEERLQFAIRSSVNFAVYETLVLLAMILLLSLFVGLSSIFEAWFFFTIFPVVLGVNAFIYLMSSQPFLEPEGLDRSFSELSLSGTIVGLAFAVTEYFLLTLTSLENFIPVAGVVGLSFVAFGAGWGVFVVYLSVLRREKRAVIEWLTLELEDD